mgnify:CR=1 FL=1
MRHGNGNELTIPIDGRCKQKNAAALRLDMAPIDEEHRVTAGERVDASSGTDEERFVHSSRKESVSDASWI